MAQYIERTKVTDALIDNTSIVGDELEEAVNAICAIPAADVRPVVRGKWRLGGYGQISNATEKWYDKYLQGGFLYCSVCKGRTSVKYNFCPNCGADMRDANDEKA